MRLRKGVVRVRSGGTVQTLGLIGALAAAALSAAGALSNRLGTAPLWMLVRTAAMLPIALVLLRDSARAVRPITLTCGALVGVNTVILVLVAAGAGSGAALLDATRVISGMVMGLMALTHHLQRARVQSGLAASALVAALFGTGALALGIRGLWLATVGAWVLAAGHSSGRGSGGPHGGAVRSSARKRAGREMTLESDGA